MQTMRATRDDQLFSFRDENDFCYHTSDPLVGRTCGDFNELSGCGEIITISNERGIAGALARTIILPHDYPASIKT